MKKIIDKIMLRFGYEPVRKISFEIRKQVRVQNVVFSYAYTLGIYDNVENDYFKRQAIMRAVDEFMKFIEWGKTVDESYPVPVVRLQGTIRIVDPATTEVIAEPKQTK